MVSVSTAPTPVTSVVSYIPEKTSLCDMLWMYKDKENIQHSR